MSIAPSRRRRPALACEECRRRKIRCDRKSPCTPCTKADLPDCLYVRDDRESSTKPPFEAGETQFSVFQQTMLGLKTWSPNGSTTVPPASSNGDADGETGVHSQGNHRQRYHQQAQFQTYPHQPQQQEDDEFGVMLQRGYRTSNASLLDMTDIQSIGMPPMVFSPIDIPLEAGLSWEMWSQSSVSPGSKETVQLYPSLRLGASGAFYKGRHLSRSHWIHYAHQPAEVLTLIECHDTNKQNQASWSFSRCKSIRKAIKQRTSRTDVSCALRATIPTKTVSDQLVQSYLRTLQAVFGILHVPSFLMDYENHWRSPKTSSEPFIALLVLVLSIGSPFRSNEPGVSRTLSSKWTTAASNWLRSTKERTRLSMDGIRVQCLLLLARQVNGLPFDSDRLSTGSLYRAASDAGLQVFESDDGEDGSKIMDTEARQRLWAAVVELDLQVSMDWGSLPIASGDESIYSLPSSTDAMRLDTSEEGHANVTSVSQHHSLDQFTHSSLQILLAKTLPIRLKVARFLNQGTEHSFEALLALSAQFLDEFKECHDLIEKYRKARTPPTPFQIRLFDLLMRRFILSLHHPFAVKAMHDPRYAYSRNICIDTSMTLLGHLSRSDEPESEQLQLRGMGLFRDVYLQSALYLTGEITNQVDTGVSIVRTSQSSDAARKEMRELVDRFSQLAGERIMAGETNIKRYVLISCLLAQTDAKHQAVTVELSVSRTLEQTLEKCGSLLEAQLQTLTNATSIDDMAQGNHANRHEWSQWEEFLA